MYVNPERWINGSEDLAFADFGAGFEHRHDRRWGTSGQVMEGQYNPLSNSLCRCTCETHEEIRLAEIGADPILV